MQRINRRGFLKYITAFGAYLAGGISFPLKLWGGVADKSLGGRSSSGKSRVALVRNSAVLTKNREVNHSVAGEMVNSGMLSLTGEFTPDQAW